MKKKKRKLVTHYLLPYRLILQAWAVTVLIFRIRGADCTWGIFGISFHILILQVESIIKHSRRNLSTKKKKKSWHVPYALGWHLDTKSATPNSAKMLPKTPEIKFLIVPSLDCQRDPFYPFFWPSPPKVYQRWSKHPISHLAMLETMQQWPWNVCHFYLSYTNCTHKAASSALGRMAQCTAEFSAFKSMHSQASQACIITAVTASFWCASPRPIPSFSYLFPSLFVLIFPTKHEVSLRQSEHDFHPVVSSG